ncbi:2-keto-4-pentenoate hydratase [Dietzia lutea]|uniref:2-keto-4-pentenoate hydratase n=2 Tax=Dietzia lutea TaxID=546160 RepID=A0A2S1R4Y6_9ACTN|nr:2-keto-4-pentenoate hydratase [Dietzia lutea]
MPVMLTEETRATLAQRLWGAETDVSPIAPLTDAHPDMNADDAFEIQLVNIRRKLDAGAVVTGHKVGLASKAMQEMMGVDEPDYGHLLDTMEYPEGTPIEAARFCFPRVEVEVGFVLGADIPPEGCSQEEAAAAIEWVVPSIELIDSRIRDWKIKLPDTIADNASSCGYVIGQQRVRLADIDVAAIDATLYKNGEFLASGRSDAVLGNPLNSVGWLASTVAKFGVRLRKGDVILPGTAIRAMDATPGDTFRAEFAGLGDVTMAFR